MERMLFLFVDHPVGKVHVEAIISEMKETVNSLVAAGVSSEIIAEQLSLFEERIKAVIDNVLGENRREDEDSDEENTDGSFKEFESEEEAAAKQAADAQVKARIRLAVETSQKEVEKIRARGEDNRYIAEEERRLEETIDMIIRAHTENLRAAKVPLPFRALSSEQRAEAEEGISWVEAQFARLHVAETSNSGSKLENATVKHSFYSSELKGILQMLAPEFDENLKKALKQEKKKKRIKEKACAALLKHIGKQERKNKRQQEHDARRKADHDARYKERQLERLQQRLHTLQDGTPIHHEITRVQDEM